MDEDLVIDETAASLSELPRLMHAAILAHPEFSGFTMAQAKAMWCLQQSGRSSVGEIAERLGVSMSTASEMVDRLVEAGWAERGTNPANRRQVLVWLTPQAEAFGARLNEFRRAQVRAAFARLEPSDRFAFHRGLQVLAETLRESAATDAAVAREPAVSRHEARAHGV